MNVIRPTMTVEITHYRKATLQLFNVRNSIRQKLFNFIYKFFPRLKCQRVRLPQRNTNVTLAKFCRVVDGVFLFD